MVRRTAATSGQVRLYEVDEAGRRLGEYVKDASQPLGWRAVQEFVYLDNWRIVGLVDYAPGGGSSLMAVLSDPITGTPRQVMDGSGDIRWDWDSKEAFGNQAPDQAPTSGKAALVFDARFPGQWYDSASGLFHNNWREYWARAGRYTQVDPIGLAGGANPYAYAGGNPVEAIDPFGLDALSIHSWISNRITNVDQAIVSSLAQINAKPLPQEVADFSAGWGDTVSTIPFTNYSLSRYARQLNCTETYVNKASKSYMTGSSFGFANSAAYGLSAIGRSVNYPIVLLARRGKINLYHYTSNSGYSAIQNSSPIANSGIFGRGFYATPFGPRTAKLLGARSTEAAIKVDRTMHMSGTSMPGNILIKP